MTLYMPLFRRCVTLSSLKQIHAHLLVTGRHHQPPAATKLIESYYQMSCHHYSELIFYSFPNPDSFMWGVIIKCHAWSNSFEQAIALYQRMLISVNGIHMGSFVYPSVLKACSGFGDWSVGAKVHARIVKAGFLRDEVIETSLVDMYGELGCSASARKVFDDMPRRDLVSWSSLISCYIDNGLLMEGLDMFRLLIGEDLELDSVTFINVVDACGELDSLKLGKSLHGYVLRNQIRVCVPLNNSMITMYSKCGDLLSAERIFSNVYDRSVTTWTTMISSYNRNGCFKEALHAFLEMAASQVEPNFVTMMSVIGSCAGLGFLREGRSAHCFLLKTGGEQLDFLSPAIIELYATCNKLNYCENVLLMARNASIVCWNSLISAYSHKGLPNEALSMFLQMQQQGLKPDSFSISSSLSACADTSSLHLGQQIHSYAYKGNLLTEFVQNSLIDMYSKCGLVDVGYSIFTELPSKTISTWNCMICGFAQAGFSESSIKLFKQMHLAGLEMNEVTFLGALQACSNSGHLDNGKWLHQKLIIFGIKSIQIDSALVDMYSKCGEVEVAQKVFDYMPERNQATWSALIASQVFFQLVAIPEVFEKESFISD